MKTVILLAYEFPPLIVGGSQRPYRFARYLKENGYYPIVLTPGAELHERQVDNDFHDGIIAPEYCQIIRTGLEPPKHGRLRKSGYLSLSGDEAKRWRSACIDAARKVARERDIAALIATVPPFSIADLGAEISEMLGCPLLLDMRDAWSQWVITPYASVLHYTLIKRLEARAINRASRVITTSEQTRLDLLNVHPGADPKKIVTITNSFDPPERVKEQNKHDESRNELFTIGYIGSFYYDPYQREMMFSPWWSKKPHQYLQYVPRQEDWLYRSPHFFFRAVRELKMVCPDVYHKLKIEFAGAVPAWLPAMISEFGLEDKVFLHGTVSRERSLHLQYEFDSLLITSSKVVGGRDYSIAGKTFEYILANKPIIAFVCEGAQRDLLEKIGLAKICNPDHLDQAVEGLQQLVEGKFVTAPKPEEIEKLSVGYCTSLLAKVIRTVESENETA